MIRVASPDSTSSLDKYVLCYMGGDALNSLCFRPPMEQIIVCLDALIIHELMALFRAHVEVLGFSSSWRCLHCGFAANYLQSLRPFLRK